MPTALVVDDDPDLRALSRMILDRAGYDVWTEADGESGWRAARRLRPDVALLDWLMPGRSGLELCQDVRGEPALAHTAVLLVTARDQDYEIELARTAGADSYVIKPFTAEHLLGRIESARERRGGAGDGPGRA